MIPRIALLAVLPSFLLAHPEHGTAPGAPIAFLGDNPNRKQWANFKVEPKDQHLGIFTAPHGLGFAPNGDLYVQDWNVSGRLTKLKRK